MKSSPPVPGYRGAAPPPQDFSKAANACCLVALASALGPPASSKRCTRMFADVSIIIIHLIIHIGALESF